MLGKCPNYLKNEIQPQPLSSPTHIINPMGKYLKSLAALVVFLIVVSGILVYYNMDKITPNEDFFELSIGDVPEVILISGFV